MLPTVSICPRWLWRKSRSNFIRRRGTRTATEFLLTGEDSASIRKRFNKLLYILTYDNYASKTMKIVHITVLAWGMSGWVSLTRAAPAPAQLAMSSQVQYSKVIQGAQDPIYAFVYNDAPTGSAAGNYTISSGYSYMSPISYIGTETADGGTGFTTLPFNFDTSRVAPGLNVPVSLTLKNNTSQTSVTQSAGVTVLAHSAPALVLGGKVVSLTSANNVKFQTTPQAPFAANPGAPVDNPNLPDLTNASLPPQEAGTEGPAGGFAPGMIGDPPGEPTAELDLDSVTASSTNSPLAIYLKPFTDLPSTDDPTENVDTFYVNLFTDTPGTYSDTFTLYYSDEQDLPGAAAPGSESVSLTVTATEDASEDIDWDVITVPEPASACMLFAVLTILPVGRSHGRVDPVSKRSNVSILVDEQARGHGLRADESEFARVSAV
jgi:hypothetical protein